MGRKMSYKGDSETKKSLSQEKCLIKWTPPDQKSEPEFPNFVTMIDFCNFWICPFWNVFYRLAVRAARIDIG